MPQTKKCVAKIAFRHISFGFVSFSFPVKCCSPCFAPCLSALTSFVELLAKIPYKLLRWMCYLGSDEDDGTETAKVADGSDSKEYGSTN